MHCRQKLVHARPHRDIAATLATRADMSSDFLQKGIEQVQKAIDADNGGRYEDAWKLYMLALEYFMTALKYEKNRRSHDQIKAKAAEYMTRAEELKQHLQQQDAQKDGGSGASSQKLRGGKDEDKEDKENAKLRSSIQNAIVSEKPNVQWSDVAGLDAAKEALKEAVILPVKFPQLFVGNRKPVSGILLYGPPGTGKSYLAKAVATESNATFFSISSSDLVSKWMGESERLVKQLFTAAREAKPSVIFIDEVDALCGSRDESSSEASRRIITELLVQMNGVGQDDTGVLVLGATNIPWQLDAAVRRRFERRIYIPLPDAAARARMFELNVDKTPTALTAADFRELGRLTDGYSGHDVSVVVKDALMQPVRKLQQATHFKPVTVNGQQKLMPCSPGDAGAVEKSWMDVESDELELPPLELKDFIRSVASTRPTVNAKDLQRQIEFTNDFGQEGA